MKSRLISLLLLSAALAAPSLSNAQSPNAYNVTGAPPPNPNPTVTGSMQITFGTVSQASDSGKIPKGATDVYTVNLNVANSVLLHGTITRLPYVAATFGSQQGSLTFDVDTDVVNPRNPKQTRNIGKLAGSVPVDAKNVYHWDQGGVAIDTFALGTAVPVHSKFDGVVMGKPPGDTSLLAKIRKLPISISRSIHGQTVTMVITQYDVMTFSGHILAAGPVQTYPAVTVSGELLYNYSNLSWVFHGVTCSYSIAGQAHTDTLSGDIRYVKDPKYETNGLSSYQVNAMVNEPPPSESAAFAPASSEADFFATDDNVQGLTGTIAYHDTWKDPSHPSDDSVVADAVTVDLVGNHLTKVQVMYMVKILFASAIGPFNGS